MKHYFTSPWWAVFFIFFFPLIVVYAYVDFVRSSELNARLGWLLMIGGLAYLMRKTWMQKVLLGVLILMGMSGALDILYAVTFGGVFTSASFEAMALTNDSEATEFFWAYVAFDNIALLVVYLLVVYLSLRNINFKTIEKQRHKVLAGLGVLMCIVAAQQVYDRGRFFDVFPGFVGVGIDYARNHEGMQAIIEQRKELYDNKAMIVSSAEESQTYVVVIGESLNRNHLQLYGYPRETSPNLIHYKDQLIRFNNVISAFAQTSQSLSHALTEANLQNNLSYKNAISLLGVTKKAGFKTFWISNQQPLRIPTTPIAALADKQHFISHDFKGVENLRFDGYLLPSIKEAINDKATKKVIFVHLMGSHLQYANRYPAEFDYFNNGENVNAYTENLSEGALKYINQYDNSVRYTDYIIGEILSELAQQDKIAALSFFADHGEEVFDSKDFKGHGPDGVTKNMLEIPFVLWRNQAYSNKFSEIDSIMQSQVNKAFMLDDYFHFGLCFMHIKSDLLNPSRNLCSKDYIEQPRKVYNIDYDKEFK